MGDGILDGYPIIQDQTSPNLAHIPTTNLVLQSNQFDTTWSASNLTLTSGQSGINNTNDAWLFNATGSSANVTQSVSSSGDNTFSVFAKAGTENSIFIRISGSSSPRAFFNLTNGTLIAETNTTHTSIKNVGNGWYRVSITGNDTITDARIYVANSSQSFPSSGNIYVQNSQLEAQSQATAYIKSDGIAAVRKSSTTNLIPYSEDFNNAAWYKTAAISIVSNYAAAPDGTQTASRVVSTGGSYPQFHETISGLTVGQVYTVSFYVKSDGTTQIEQAAHISGISPTITFTPNNDWVRIEYTRTATATSHTFVIYTSSGSAAASSYLIWGYQVEKQTQAETYAPTKGIPVTIDLFTENNYGTMTNMSASDIVIDTPGVS